MEISERPAQQDTQISGNELVETMRGKAGPGPSTDEVMEMLRGHDDSEALHKP